MNAQVCLYGSGKFGELMRPVLKFCRPDVGIICFADSFRAGVTDDGTEIVKVDEFKGRIRTYDHLIITSMFRDPIEAALRHAGIFSYMTINPGFADRLLSKLDFFQSVEKVLTEGTEWGYIKNLRIQGLFPRGIGLLTELRVLRQYRRDELNGLILNELVKLYLLNRQENLAYETWLKMGTMRAELYPGGADHLIRLRLALHPREIPDVPDGEGKAEWVRAYLETGEDPV